MLDALTLDDPDYVMGADVAQTRPGDPLDLRGITDEFRMVGAIALEILTSPDATKDHKLKVAADWRALRSEWLEGLRATLDAWPVAGQAAH